MNQTYRNTKTSLPIIQKRLTVADSVALLGLPLGRQLKTVLEVTLPVAHRGQYGD